MSGALFLSEIILLISKRSSAAKGGASHDRKSLLLIWLTIVFSIFASVYLSAVFPASVYPVALCWTGTGIFIVGMVVRFLAIYQLGKAFTVDVAVSTTQKIQDTGLYKHIRHPSYTGALMEFLGLSLLFGSWVSMSVLMVPICTVFIIRINLEEGVLLKFFGAGYREYMNRTKRLLPFIY